MGIKSYGFLEKLKPSSELQMQLITTEINWTN